MVELALFYGLVALLEGPTEKTVILSCTELNIFRLEKIGGYGSAALRCFPGRYLETKDVD